jgi:hypothetical protein
MTFYAALVGMLWGLLFAATGLFLRGARQGLEEAFGPPLGLILVAPYVGAAAFVLALPLAAFQRHLVAGRSSALAVVLAAFSFGPLLGLGVAPFVELCLPAVARTFEFGRHGAVAGAVGGIGLGWGCARQALLERLEEIRP